MRRAPTYRWRGGRVAEGGGLLNRYTVNPVSWVRIPSPPPPRHSRPFAIIRKIQYPYYLWAIDRTGFPAEVAEMALAHAVSDKVETAYRRGDLFQKRRQLVDAWARHCATVKAGAM